MKTTRKMTKVLFGGGLILFLALALISQAQAQPTVIDTIAVDTSGGRLATNPTTNRVYVVDTSLGNILVVIDGASNTVVNTIGTLSTFQAGIAVNPATNQIYVSQQFSNVVQVFDGATETPVATAPAPGRPFGLAVNPNTNRIYVSAPDNDALTVIDGVDNTSITSIPMGDFPSPVAVNPNTNRVYVGNRNSVDLTVIDGAFNTVITTIPLSGSIPGCNSVAVNPATNKIYVSNASDNTVTVIDGASNMVEAVIPTGTFPCGIGVNPDTNRIYVANNLANTVSVIDGIGDTVVATVPVGISPLSVDVIPSTSRIYVTNTGSGTVSVIEDLVAVEIDHFKCYEASGDNMDVIVDLEDQFGAEPQVLVGTPRFFCNPVDKNGEGIINPEAHLTCYEINGDDKKLDVLVGNQFGEQTLKVEVPRLLCVPSEKIDVAPSDE